MEQDMNIIELAKQAGFEIDCCSLQWHERIERFAHLVRAEVLGEAIDLVAFHGGSVEIEAAIRALAKETT
jgi:hypothetical protein